MKFFFDNCISFKFVQALRILAQIQGYELVHLTDRFAADTPDEEWIRALSSEEPWVIISGAAAPGSGFLIPLSGKDFKQIYSPR